MARKKIKNATDQRKFTIVYNDFLESGLLDKHEKLIFIAIKRFADNNTLKAFPSLKTLRKITGISISWIRKSIEHMEQLGVLSVESREDEEKGHQSNVYTLYDYAEIWNAESGEEIKTIKQNNFVNLQEVSTELLEKELERRKKEKEKELVSTEQNEVQDISIAQKEDPKSDEQNETQDINNAQKAKGLASEPTKAHQQAPNNNQNNQSDMAYSTTNLQKSQVSERYTIEKIRTIFDYDIMIADRPSYQREIEAVMNILHTTLNTTKPMIRIAGEDKPSEVVIGKLMKLTFNEITYCIEKYSEQTERIKKPTSYMLTLLYNAKEQMELDLTNEVKHDMANWNAPEAPEDE